MDVFCCEKACAPGHFGYSKLFLEPKFTGNLRVPNVIHPRNKALFPGRYHFVSLDSHHRVLNILV